MSIEYLNAAFKTEVGDATQKFVLVCLADYADEYGYAYPSLSTLEKRCDLSRPSVVACIKALLDKGLITKCSTDNIPSKYLRKSNQNCYHLEILSIRLVKEVNQLSNLTSEDALPELVKDLNQCLVKQLNSNHHIKPSVTHQDKKDISKDICKKAKLPSKTFELTEELIDWGSGLPIQWDANEMHQHYEYFMDYMASNAKTYKDAAAAFRNCVRGNWAKLRQKSQGGTFLQSTGPITKRDLILDRNRKALEASLRNDNEEYYDDVPRLN